MLFSLVSSRYCRIFSTMGWASRRASRTAALVERLPVFSVLPMAGSPSSSKRTLSSWSRELRLKGWPARRKTSASRRAISSATSRDKALR